MIQEFASVLQKQIRKDMNDFADDLANGCCKSYDDYQRLCGTIRGLALAEQYLLDLAKKAREQND